MISKELLSEVLGYTPFKIDKIKQVGGIGLTLILLNQDGTVRSYQNIYQLAHKCKEWALSNKYMIDSNISPTFKEVNNGIVGTSLIYNLNNMESKRFQSDTELEAIFKACEYIMENKCGS